MKLTKQLLINNNPVALVDHDLTLDLKRPGKAVFTVNESEKLSGLIELKAGYKQKLNRVFFGFIEQSTKLDNKQQRIEAREFWAVLAYPLSLNLRHVKLSKVVDEISNKTGLSFTIGKGSYNETKAPFFYSIANGYHAIDALKTVFKIPQFICQQRGDNIYMGSWQDQPKINLDQKWFSEFGKGPRANIPALPQLKPGFYIESLGFIESIRFSGANMGLSWVKTL